MRPTTTHAGQSCGGIERGSTMTSDATGATAAPGAAGSDVTTEVRLTTHPDDMDTLSPAALRARVLVDDLFVPGELKFVLSHHDRILIGGAMPSGGSLEVTAPQEIKAQHLCDRRELGVVCLAGSGTVTADDDELPMAPESIAYLGQGTRRVTLSGDAVFYLVSAPAHRRHPTVVRTRDEAEAVPVGDAGKAGARTIRKYVHQDGIASCELALGITTLEPGSVWNTMPCHTHDRRTEVYLYFDLPADERVVHLCGRPDNTRSVIVADRQAVINPPWSVHFGAGTAPYKFIWSTAGENLAYDDMDSVATAELR